MIRQPLQRQQAVQRPREVYVAGVCVLLSTGVVFAYMLTHNRTTDVKMFDFIMTTIVCNQFLTSGVILKQRSRTGLNVPKVSKQTAKPDSLFRCISSSNKLSCRSTVDNSWLGTTAPAEGHVVNGENPVAFTDTCDDGREIENWFQEIFNNI